MMEEDNIDDDDNSIMEEEIDDNSMMGGEIDVNSNLVAGMGDHPDAPFDVDNILVEGLKDQEINPDNSESEYE